MYYVCVCVLIVEMRYIPGISSRVSEANEVSINSHIWDASTTFKQLSKTFTKIEKKLYYHFTMNRPELIIICSQHLILMSYIGYKIDA